MIALSQAGNGWEAVYSASPNQFFQMHDYSREQIFIADDAFGRTEYDPARTSDWESQLEFVLRRLDQKHWLVWTSRKHILERAIARMDLAGRARSFPDPGAVLVDVKSLSSEERALVLFRHARAANIEEECKALVREHARSIVGDPDFTPERMRRFVSESLPELARKKRTAQLNPYDVALEIHEAIRNPTKQMRLTFRFLPIALKWYLVSMLELPSNTWTSGRKELRKIYSDYCPDKDKIPFEEATRQLEEAFIRTRHKSFERDVDWIHPSYRDLVIDELTMDSELRTEFLRRATLEGLKIAVSDTGGEEGDRRLPFMLSAESWQVLKERCVAIAAEGETQAALLEVLSSAAAKSTPDERTKWARLIEAVCDAVRQKWNSEKYELSAPDLAAFTRARSSIGGSFALPDLAHTFDQLEGYFRESLEEATTFDDFDPSAFDGLTALAEEVAKVDPGFLAERDFPDKYEQEMLRVFQTAEEGILDPGFSDEPDELRELATSMSGLAKAMERLSPLSQRIGAEARDQSARLSRYASRLEDRAGSFEPPDDPDNDGYERSSSDTDGFDINRLFAEL